jgi:threonine dehydrogenase-like Zn-dependent dehydrogenase
MLPPAGGEAPRRLLLRLLRVVDHASGGQSTCHARATISRRSRHRRPLLTARRQRTHLAPAVLQRWSQNEGSRRRTMKAMVYHGPADVRAERKPDPRIEHPEDVVLRVTRTAICGSDLHLYRGLVPDTRVGTTFGHEFTGVVEEVGPGVTKLRRGDRIAVPFNISCGRCYYCEQELYALCENSNPNSEFACGVFGYSHTTGGYEGGQAEYVRVPFADVGPMKIPDDMDDEDVLFLTDIFPTGYMGAEMGDIRGGDTVVVYGLGPVGLFAAKSAWLMGAGRVIGIDKVPERLAFAQQWAGIEVVNFDEVGDVVNHVKEMCGNRGPDVAIDAVGLEADGSSLHTFLGRAMMMEAGNPIALNWAIHTVRKGGRISVIGVYGPPHNIVPLGIAMNKNITLRLGQCNTKRYMPHLLEHIRAGRVDAKAIISHRMPLDDVTRAYEMFAGKLDNCRKVVLVPQH